MTSRAERLTRMVSLMKLQLRLSEWQLVQLRQREQHLQDEEIYLVGTLNGAELPVGSSSYSISRRLAATSVGARALQAEAKQQLGQVHAQSRRVKHLEQVAKGVIAGKQREAEMRFLEEITGAHSGVRDWTSISS
ncbi:hypothetical protein [Bradyrhizobium iriomotense]|uniref:Flagellar FliJ protein n=1 Tax=Bradyrhizobium iriomotense TaxID=441950 RepID=A0ABQ6ASE8_9BRAD|nr:hypothetical protein [Bradyrhizobium iriomotense]GLR85168.1 hypothetical protein GCM10007857_18780 [Bradyrhizobium iriomotense]